MTILIETPFEFFTDNDGDALENGKIYIGTENRDPETNAISIYWDKALTIAAEQPVRTLSGKPAYNGSPGNLYITESNFSITVRDKNDVLVETLLSAGDISSSSSASGSGVTPNNRVISGAVRANSEQPAFLSIDGGNANVTILGDTTALSLAINGTIVGVETDVVETGLTTASGSNNTCLVNDSSLTDQLSSKYTGEDDTTLTIDAAGSEISSRIGQIAAFQKDGGTELMLAYIKSATQLTNVRRGWFYDEDGDPIVRETLADDDQLNILSLGWIFMLNDGGTVDVTYNSPTYSYTAPTSPTAGDYWFDMDEDVWKQYTTVWVQSNNTLIGMAAVGTTLTEGKREIDYFHDYRDTNTINLEVFSDEIIRTVDKTSNVFAYSKTLRIDHFKTVWNNTLDMETGSIGNSTKYYLYIASTGETFISTEKYYIRNDLRGRYHPYEAWRYVGSGTTDAAGLDWETATSDNTTDAIDDQLSLLDQKDIYGPGVTKYKNGAVYKFDQWEDVAGMLTGSNGKVVPYKKSLSNVYTGFEIIKRMGTGQQGVVHKPTIGMGLQWLKNMDQADGNALLDILRNANYWVSDATAAHAYTAAIFDAMDIDRLSIGSHGIGNAISEDYVSWNWSYPRAKAWHKNGEASRKVITPWGILDSVEATNASAISVAGQVIIEVYNPLTGNGALLYIGNEINRLMDISGGIAPKFMIVKCVTTVSAGYAYSSYLNGGTAPATYHLVMNTTAAQGGPETALWNSVEPTSTIISVGSGTPNVNGHLMVLYYYSPVAGLQKFGGFAGNNSANNQASGCTDGMVFIKLRDGGTGNWLVTDILRGADQALYWDIANAETADGSVAFGTDGQFDLSGSDANTNASGDDYIYGHFGTEMEIQGDIDVYPTTSATVAAGLDTATVLIKYSGDATLNTELKLYVSKESTPDWEIGELELQGTFTDKYGTTWKILKAVVSMIDNDPQGTDLRWRIVTSESGSETEHNIEYIKIDAR